MRQIGEEERKAQEHLIFSDVVYTPVSLRFLVHNCVVWFYFLVLFINKYCTWYCYNWILFLNFSPGAKPSVFNNRVNLFQQGFFPSVKSNLCLPKLLSKLSAKFRGFPSFTQRFWQYFKISVFVGLFMIQHCIAASCDIWGNHLRLEMFCEFCNTWCLKVSAAFWHFTWRSAFLCIIFWPIHPPYTATNLSVVRFDKSITSKTCCYLFKAFSVLEWYFIRFLIQNF